MDTFLKLNRDKLKSIYIRIALLFLGFVSIILVVAYLMGNFPDIELLTSIYLTAGIGMPIFIMFLSFLGWQLNHKASRKAFSKTPFDKMENIGFYKTLINDNAKWSFVSEIKEGEVNGFTLIMNASYAIIEVKIPTAWKKLDKNEYNRLSEKFKQHNIEFRIGSLVKQYNIKRQAFHTAADLRSDLEQFTNLLRHEGFEPKSVSKIIS